MMTARLLLSYQKYYAATQGSNLFTRPLINNENRFRGKQQRVNMSLFCANLSFMFTEKTFLERYDAARSAGFKAVESGFPFGLEIGDVVQAKNNAGIQQVLINTFTGDVTKGQLGFAAIPGKEAEFQDSIRKTIEYAKALNARKIHVMSGIVENPTEVNYVCYEANLRHAVRQFEKENITCVIEPINSYSVPNYYMNCYKKALRVVKAINSPNLRIMLDIFHMQHITGNLTNTIKDLKDYIGHVQIAQVPNRNEPDTLGEIDYKYVLAVLKDVGYTDWIGLEYKPLEDAAKGLKWIEDYKYTL